PALYTDHLFLAQALIQRRIVPARQAETENTGTTRRVERAMDHCTRQFANTIVQALNPLSHQRADPLHAHFLEQRQARLQGEGAEHVRAAAFEAPCTAGRLPVLAGVVAGVL